jgi:hypothetical protein
MRNAAVLPESPVVFNGSTLQQVNDPLLQGQNVEAGS